MIEIIKIDVFKKLLFRIHDSTGHGVHNVITFVAIHFYGF